MTPENIINFLSTGFVPLVKIFVLLAILLYALFAGILVRQIQIMNTVVEEANFTTALFSIALTHLAAVAVLFLIALLIL